MPDQPPPVSVTVTPPEPGFQVTLRDVYDKLGEVATKVDRMQDLPGDVKDHEHRLRDIEANYVSKASARWLFMAMVGVISVAVAVVALILQQ